MITPGHWFLGESELDPGEWGFDGTLLAGRESDLYDSSNPGSIVFIAEHIRSEDDARLLLASPLLLAGAESLLAELDAELPGYCGCCPETPDSPATACGACQLRGAVKLARGQS